MPFKSPNSILCEKKELSEEDVAKAACLAIKVFYDLIIKEQSPSVSVNYWIGEQTIIINIDSPQIGSILGKKGKTIDAVRTLVDCIGGRHGVRIKIETVYK